MVTVAICMFSSTQYKNDWWNNPQAKADSRGVSLRVQLEKLQSASVGDGSSADIQEERTLH